MGWIELNYLYQGSRDPCQCLSLGMGYQTISNKIDRTLASTLMESDWYPGVSWLKVLMLSHSHPPTFIPVHSGMGARYATDHWTFQTWVEQAFTQQGNFCSAWPFQSFSWLMKNTYWLYGNPWCKVPSGSLSPQPHLQQAQPDILLFIRRAVNSGPRF